MYKAALGNTEIRIFLRVRARDPKTEAGGNRRGHFFLEKRVSKVRIISGRRDRAVDKIYHVPFRGSRVAAYKW